jgi:periplasmic protein TonB
MRSPAVIASALGHVAVIAVLLLIAHQREKHQALSVVVVDKPKAQKPKPPPPPPPEPPKIVRPPPKPAAVAPPAPAPTGEHPAPVALSGLELSNEDGPGVALGGPAPQTLAVPESRLHAPKTAAAKTSMKTALEDCKEEPTKPEPIFKEEIAYPAQARADGVEGRLVLRLVIGADGSVSQVDVVSSVESALDAAAIVSAKKWRFKPALRCGRPVGGGVYTLARRFELGD